MHADVLVTGNNDSGTLRTCDTKFVDAEGDGRVVRDRNRTCFGGDDVKGCKVWVIAPMLRVA